jgi:hypothetical protein
VPAPIKVKAVPRTRPGRPNPRTTPDEHLMPCVAEIAKEYEAAYEGRRLSANYLKAELGVRRERANRLIERHYAADLVTA